jgi:hypothetical protein
VVEEEKQEHVEKVKELLGWVSTLARNTQGKITPSHTKESTEIEKAILEQQVSRKSIPLYLGGIICSNTLEEQINFGPFQKQLLPE